MRDMRATRWVVPGMARVTGAVLIYCKGERVLAKAIGLGWFKCPACGELFRGAW